MLRCMPRWHPISRQIIAGIRSQIRLASTETKSKPPQESTCRGWFRQQFPPVLHRPPYAAPVRWLVYGSIFITSCHIWTAYVGSFEPTYGISMLPTLSSFGDWVFISKYYRRGRGIETGDIVSFKHPVRSGEHAIKRVLAMGGDFVLMNTPGKSEAMIQVPQGHCWVVGDNMLHSRDSRMFGPLPLALISGKVIAKVSRPGFVPQFAWMEHGFQPADTEDDID